MRCPLYIRSSLENDRKADIAGGLKPAITGTEKHKLTRWKTDLRKAIANKAGDRARNGIRPPDRVVGS